MTLVLTNLNLPHPLMFCAMFCLFEKQINHSDALKHDLCYLSFVEIGLIVLHSSENLFYSFVIDLIVEKGHNLRVLFLLNLLEIGSVVLIKT